MKKNIVSIILKVLLICSLTIETGILIGYYLLSHIDFDRYKVEYNVSVAE